MPTEQESPYILHIFLSNNARVEIGISLNEESTKAMMSGSGRFLVITDFSNDRVYFAFEHIVMWKHQTRAKILKPQLVIPPDIMKKGDN